MALTNTTQISQTRLLDQLRWIIHSVIRLARSEQKSSGTPALERASDPLLRAFYEWIHDRPHALEILRRHGMAAVARDLLVQGGYQDLPEELNDHARKSVASWLASGRIYGEVLERFMKVGITPVVLKGMWLSNNVYPKPWWRTYADIDLLIDGESMHIADRELKQMGYQPHYAAMPTRRKMPRWVNSRVIHSAEYKKEAFHIDLHFSLIPRSLPSAVDTEKLIRECEPTRLALGPGGGGDDLGPSINVLRLSPRDTLLHLAIHGGYHCMDAGMRAVLDMLLTLVHDSGRFAWQSFVERCQEFEVEYLVAGPLALMNLVYDDNEEVVPQWVLDSLDPQQKVQRNLISEEFVQMFLRAPNLLTSGEESPLVPTRQGRNFVQPLRSAPMRKKLRAFFYHMVPSPRRMAARYGTHPLDPRTYIMYGVRPFILFYRYLPTLFFRPGRPNARQSR